MDKTKTYTIEEIRAAFDILKDTLNEDIPGAGEDRYLLDDVATDVCHILEGTSVGQLEESYERECDDDETLFVGQNYNWFMANEEW
ncbi:MAG: hypothetical protein DCC51_16890 [Anaerolineae bacterium]|nr:MAG: hypothetical protein DCC51_16890 [Anaerolineae bacterium]